MKPLADRALAPGQHDDEIAVAGAVNADRSGEVAALSELAQVLLRREQQLGRHMARALHDRLGQSLAAIRLHLELLRPGESLPSRDTLMRDIDQIDHMLEQAIAGVRKLLAEMSPPLLSERGLAAALDHEIQQRDAGADTDVLLEADDDVRGVRWPRDVEYGAFMIAREAMDQAMADPDTSLVCVRLNGHVGRFHLDVLDDGRGRAKPDGGEGRSAVALTTMRERARGMAARIDMGAAEGGGHRMTLQWEADAT